MSPWRTCSAGARASCSCVIVELSSAAGIEDVALPLQECTVERGWVGKPFVEVSRVLYELWR